MVKQSCVILLFTKVHKFTQPQKLINNLLLTNLLDYTVNNEGELLKRAVKLSGLKTQEVADILGVEYAYVYKFYNKEKIEEKYLYLLSKCGKQPLIDLYNKHLERFNKDIENSSGSDSMIIPLLKQRIMDLEKIIKQNEKLLILYEEKFQST